MTPIRTAARTLLGALFVGSGWMALRHPDRLVPKAKPVTDRLSPALQAAMNSWLALPPIGPDSASTTTNGMPQRVKIFSYAR